MAATGTSEHIAWAEHRPLLKLATEFGVDYDDVRELASVVGVPRTAFTPAQSCRISAASRRILQELGASASYTLYDRIKRILGR